MKPNDKAIEAARAEGKRWETGSYYSAGRQNSSCHSVLRQDGENGAFDVVAEFNNHKDRDEALERLRAEAMVNAAYTAQFKSGDYAGVVERLRAAHISNRVEWEAADALEAVLAEREAWKGRQEATAALLKRVETERDAAIALAEDRLCKLVKYAAESDALADVTVALDAWKNRQEATAALLKRVETERDALAARLDLGSEEQSMTKLRIGPFLKKVRQEKQMTLRAVEEAADKEISNAYLSQLESGKIANPSPHVLFTLSLVFGVAYETLMERAGYVMPAPNRLAPVEDEELVEIAAYYFTDGSSWSALSERLRNICRRDARNVIAAIRPHIEAAERERCAKIAEGYIGNDALYCPTDAGREGYATACRSIAAAIRRGK